MNYMFLLAVIAALLVAVNIAVSGYSKYLSQLGEKVKASEERAKAASKLLVKINEARKVHAEAEEAANLACIMQSYFVTSVAGLFYGADGYVGDDLGYVKEQMEQLTREAKAANWAAKRAHDNLKQLCAEMKEL